MNEVNKTLFIPLYGKAQVSRKNIILFDKRAEEIWDKEGFSVTGKAKSKWLAYYMAMRARVFDDWTESMLKQYPDSLVLHIGCGLDSRCLRVKEKYSKWIDADLSDVILHRKNYFEETEDYHMISCDATKSEDIRNLPDSNSVIVILEGISMYLTNKDLKTLFHNLQKKYFEIHLLMDVYSEVAAKMSKYKNPVNEVGVTELYGIDNIEKLIDGTGLKVKQEYSFTPDRIVNELQGFDRIFFKILFTGKITRKIYRLYELETTVS